MNYEEYIKIHKEQIEQAKKLLDNPTIKQTLEYMKSDEFKKNLQIIKEQEKIIHKNIIENIEILQKNLVNIKSNEV